MNTTCNNYYSIAGTAVFLALGCEMEGVEPYDTGANDVNAYELKDYPIFVEQNGEDAEPSVTYYEKDGRYSANGDEISWRTVLNDENHQYTLEDWVLVSDNEDADAALVKAGFEPEDSNYTYPCVDIYEEEQNGDLDIVDVTSGRNGYPSGVRQAIVGFSSFEEAKLIAEKYQKNVVLLHKRDGWNLYEIKDCTLIDEPELNPEDLGYNNQWDGLTDESEVVEEFRSKIDGIEQMDVILSLANTYKQIYEELQIIGSDEVIFFDSDNDLLSYEKVKKHPMSWSYDTHNYIVAIM